MNERLNAAIKYVNQMVSAKAMSYVHTYDLDDHINDAANIYAETYAEYTELCEGLMSHYHGRTEREAL